MKNKTTLLLAAILAALPTFAQDQTEALALGKPVTLTIEHNTDAAKPLAYSWQKDGVNIGAGQTLTIPALAASDAGEYTATVQNQFGKAASPKLILVVGVPPSAPVIKMSFPSQTVKKQDPVTMEIVAVGVDGKTDAGVQYHWQHGTSMLVGATGPSVHIPKVNPSHAGMYAATAANEHGSVTAKARLTVVNR